MFDSNNICDKTSVTSLSPSSVSLVEILPRESASRNRVRSSATCPQVRSLESGKGQCAPVCRSCASADSLREINKRRRDRNDQKEGKKRKIELSDDGAATPRISSVRIIPGDRSRRHLARSTIARSRCRCDNWARNSAIAPCKKLRR